jgi:hypothetical protein
MYNTVDIFNVAILIVLEIGFDNILGTQLSLFWQLFFIFYISDSSQNQAWNSFITELMHLAL